MLAFTEQLHTLVAAPYPFVWLVSHEEERVVGIVEQLAQAMRRPVVVWRPEDAPDAGASLDRALDDVPSMDRGAILLVLDAHPLLDAPDRIRRLRTLASAITARQGTIVFVAPVSVVPDDLQKDWVVCDVPLPDRDELEHLLTRVLPEEEVAALDTERVSLAALGLTLGEAERAFLRAHHLADLAEARGAAFDWEVAIAAEKRRLMASASALEFCDATAGLDDVGGLEELKHWVHERRRAFSRAAREFGLPQPRGLLLVGVQGCGKSLAAKAVAGFWGVPLLRLDIGAIFAGRDAPEVALRQASRAAEAMSPCVLWVDEIEKGFDTGDGETQRLLGTLLTWLQEKTNPVFFVATANAVDRLPPELLRRGRFDEIFFVDLPDLEARKQILAIHLVARGRDPAEFDTTAVAQTTENFSGAELEQVVVSALYSAFAAERELAQTDLVAAARELIPLYKLREADIKSLRTWAADRTRPAGHDHSLLGLFGG